MVNGLGKKAMAAGGTKPLRDLEHRLFPRGVVTGRLEDSSQVCAVFRGPRALDSTQHSRQQLPVVHELRPKIVAMLERMLLQNLLTEAVNGENRRLIELRQRLLESPAFVARGGRCAHESFAQAP